MAGIAIWPASGIESQKFSGSYLATILNMPAAQDCPKPSYFNVISSRSTNLVTWQTGRLYGK